MADAEGNRYGPYDIEVPGSESEPLTEAAWFEIHRESGVISGGDLTFAGLTATLSPINARAHGSYLIREDPWSDASTPTATTFPRRDMLVVRRQRTTGEGVSAIPGKTFLTLLQGTPAATPADPDPDPDDDEPLWSWQVPGSGGTVVTGQRDLRRRGPGGDATVGDDDHAGVLVLAGSPSWTTIASVTGVSGGHPVVARFSVASYNGNSGSDRTALYRITCDGVAVMTTGVMGIPLAGQPRIPWFGKAEHTPAGGSHTWALQGQASAAAAVIADTALLTVVEKR